MKEWKGTARAKINLGLDVLRRRPDGYHELRMVMQTLSLHDEITLFFCKETTRPEIYLQVELDENLRDAEVPADERNLAFQAAALLMEEFHICARLLIVLRKRIPVAAGLAGGSADAACVLRGVNELFGLGLSGEELRRRGVRLGADVPYCILQGTALAEGIGERLTPLSPAPACWVLLAKPPVAVSTKFVYTNLRLDESTVHPDVAAQVEAVGRCDREGMLAAMGNVLETVTIPAHPVIASYKRRMEELGARRAMMSGSGPTVFGLYEKKEEALKACETIKTELKPEFAEVSEFRWSDTKDGGE